MARAISRTKRGILIVAGVHDCTDDWPDSPDASPGDIVALSPRGVVHAYTTRDGQIPKEALDTQILDEAAYVGRVNGLQVNSEPFSHFAAAYRSQAAFRASELIAAGVIYHAPDGSAGLVGGLQSTVWKDAYALERWHAGKSSTLPDAPPADRHQGIVREVGVQSDDLKRGIALDTPHGNVVIETLITKVAVGKVVEFYRHQGVWRMSAPLDDVAQQITSAVEELRQRTADRKPVSHSSCGCGHCGLEIHHVYN